MDTKSYQDYSYIQLDDGGVSIYTYHGSDETVCIPTYIHDHPVVKVGAYAFADNHSVRAVTIPEGVREIDDSAFEDCRALQSIVIPKSVSVIGERAFADCSSLQSAEIPASVRIIYVETFQNCGALRSVVLHEGLESIDWSAFENCTSLVQVTLPDSVEYIGDAAFSGCSALKSCNIPNSIVYMGRRVFVGCEELVLSITPGSFREAYAERYHLPFVTREEETSASSQRSPVGRLLDTLYKISTNYKQYRQVAGELPAMEVTMQEERSGSWKKEDGRWVMYPGFLRTVWLFDFHQNYVWDHLEEALLRVFFHPDAKLDFSGNGTTLVYEENYTGKLSAQMKVRGHYVSLCMNPEPKRYGSTTTWLEVSDSQICIIQEFEYD